MENQTKLQQMQDEMSRFEAEISGTEKSGNIMPSRTVINSSTFGVIQQKLDNDIPPPPPPPPVLSGPFGPPMMPSMGSMLPPGLGPGGPNIGGRPVAFPAIPPPPPPPSFVPPQVSRMRAPGPPDGIPTMPGVMPFMRPITLPGPAAMPPPPKPQPVILTGAPKLYRKEKEEKKEEKDKLPKEKEKKKVELPLPPAPKPAPTPKPMPAEPTPPTQTEAPGKTKKEKKSRKVVRTAGGQTWEDVTLLDWPDDDFRLFAGDLGNDVTDELLIRTFGKYSSFQRAKVVRDKRTNKSKGFGFISFKEPADFIKAMKEMDGRYVGSRPIKLRKSTWRNRSLDVVRKKEKEKAALLSLLMSGKKS